MPTNLATKILCFPPECLSQNEFYASLYGFTVKNWVPDFRTPWDPCALLPEYNPTEVTSDINLHQLYVMVVRRGGYAAVEAGRRWGEIADEMDPDGRPRVEFIRSTYQRFLHCYEIYSAKAMDMYWTTNRRHLDAFLRKMHVRDSDSYAEQADDPVKRLQKSIKEDIEKASARLIFKDVPLSAALSEVDPMNDAANSGKNEEANECSAECLAVLNGSTSNLGHATSALGIHPFHPYDKNLDHYEPPLEDLPALRGLRNEIFRLNRAHVMGTQKFTPPPSATEIKAHIYDEVQYDSDGKFASSEEEPLYPSFAESSVLDPFAHNVMWGHLPKLLEKYSIRSYDPKEPAQDDKRCRRPFHFGKWVRKHGVHDPRLHDFWRLRLQNEGGFSGHDISQYEQEQRWIRKGKISADNSSGDSSPDAGSDEGTLLSLAKAGKYPPPASLHDEIRKQERKARASRTRLQTMPAISQLQASQHAPTNLPSYSRKFRSRDSSISSPRALSADSADHAQSLSLQPSPAGLRNSLPHSVQQKPIARDTWVQATGSPHPVRPKLFTSLAERQEKALHERLRPQSPQGSYFANRMARDSGQYPLPDGLDDSAVQRMQTQYSDTPTPSTELDWSSFSLEMRSEDSNSTQTARRPGNVIVEKRKMSEVAGPNYGCVDHPPPWDRSSSMRDTIDAVQLEINVWNKGQRSNHSSPQHLPDSQQKEEHSSSATSPTSTRPIMENELYLTQQERDTITRFRKVVRENKFPVTQDNTELVNELHNVWFSRDEFRLLRQHWQYAHWSHWEEAEQMGTEWKHPRIPASPPNLGPKFLLEVDGKICPRKILGRDSSVHTSNSDVEESTDSPSSDSSRSVRPGLRSSSGNSSTSSQASTAIYRGVTYKAKNGRASAPSPELDLAAESGSWLADIYSAYFSALRKIGHPTEGKCLMHPMCLDLGLTKEEKDFLAKTLELRGISLYPPPEQQAEVIFLNSAERFGINLDASPRPNFPRHVHFDAEDSDST